MQSCAPPYRIGEYAAHCGDASVSRFLRVAPDAIGCVGVPLSAGKED
jgi:hypothetical protein